MKSLGEYSDHYLLTDTVVLAEVFEEFRNLCITHHHLDPVHYYSLPGFTWDAMLRTCKVPITLLSDKEKYEFFEKGIRGGIAQVPKRFCEASNPLLPETYNPNKPTSYIAYYDAVNLYGWAMLLKQPYTDFTWIEGNELEDFL
ncbi:Ribonuclease BN [Folsomia candida]|uniref:DNA-directed DNA polymerase n=1 Tax=Folsomia candida TaxID=158441 RepID=A0A226CVP0_FOLCA|nr:Ribonuclease BN [Folsomia candida]